MSKDNRSAIKRLFGIEPKKVDGQMAIRTIYYREQLRKIVKSIFDVKCPIDWDYDYFLNLLCFGGYVLIADSVIGVMPFRSTLTGYNYTDYPTGAVVSVPVLKEFKVSIGKTAELIYLERNMNRNFFNFNLCIDIYAEKLASADASIDVNLMNSRMAYLIEAETKAQADTIKAIYDKVSEGEPMIVYRKESLSKDGLKAFFGNIKNSYIAQEVQDTKRSIMNEFLTAIGINNSNIDKKERLITDEVNSNNYEVSANMVLWKKNIDMCLKRVKKVFPELELSIDFKFDQSNLTREVLMSDTSEHDRNMGNPLSG